MDNSSLPKISLLSKESIYIYYLSNSLKMKRFSFVLLSTLLWSNTSLAQTVEWTAKATDSIYFNVENALFTQDGRKAISTARSTIRMFDVTSSNLEWEWTYDGFSGRVPLTDISISSNYLAAISETGVICLFDLTSNSPTYIDTINTGTSFGLSISVSPNEDFVSAGLGSGWVKNYSLSSLAFIDEFEAHESWSRHLDYSDDATAILTANDDTIKTWASSGSLMHTFYGHSGDLVDVFFLKNNEFVLSASKDGEVKIWDNTTGSLLKSFSTLSNSLNDISLSADETRLISVSSDKTARVWSIDTLNPANSGVWKYSFSSPFPTAFSTVAWSPNGDTLLTGTKTNSDVALYSIPVNISLVESSASGIHVYPNPTSRFISVDIPAELKGANLNIYNASGQVVITQSNVDELSLRINLEGLPVGLYQGVLTKDARFLSFQFLRID